MWDYSTVLRPTPYWGDETYKRAIEWLDGPGVLEDWGCGTAYARQFIKHAQYIGIDFSISKYADRIASLVAYESDTDYILLRHVLEHNYNWRVILRNMLKSFRKRAVIVLFTPLSDGEDKQLAWHSKIGVPDLSLSKEDFIHILEPYRFHIESHSPETMYFITHE